MRKPPRKPDEGVFARGLGWHIVWVGLLIGGICLGIQAWTIHTGNSNGQTMVFITLSFCQLGHVLAIRSETKFLFRLGFLTNKPLLTTIVLTFLLQLILIYTPAFQKIFSLKPLTLTELLICIVLSSIVFHAVELEKFIRIKYSQKNIKALLF